MIRFFMVYGAILGLLFTYASFTGWDVVNFNNFARGGPGGPPARYHK